jgi:hypothetical protein
MEGFPDPILRSCQDHSWISQWKQSLCQTISLLFFGRNSIPVLDLHQLHRPWSESGTASKVGSHANLTAGQGRLTLDAKNDQRI